MQRSQDNSGRRKTSKYFSAEKPKDEKEMVEVPAKRKTQTDSHETVKPSPAKKIHKVDDDDDFILADTKKKPVASTPRKKLKSGSGRGTGQKPLDIDESDDGEVKHVETPSKSSGRGRGGGRGASVAPSGGRGRGAGRGGFMNFGERKDPPHKGEKVKLRIFLIDLLIALNWFYLNFSFSSLH